MRSSTPHAKPSFKKTLVASQRIIPVLKYLNPPVFETRLTFRRLWGEVPRHSEVLRAEMCCPYPRTPLGRLGRRVQLLVRLVRGAFRYFGALLPSHGSRRAFRFDFAELGEPILSLSRFSHADRMASKVGFNQHLHLPW